MTNKDIFKGVTYNSLDKQVDGDHYKNMKIQPASLSVSATINTSVTQGT